MEQQSLLSQFENDKSAFVNLFSKFTGISKSKVSHFINDNPISLIFEHTDSLNVNKQQLKKIQDLKLLKSLYSNLNSVEKDYIIDSSSKAGEYFINYFVNTKEKEKFVCAFLDAQNKIINTKVMFEGTINEAPIYPRELLKEALNHNANKIMISHNHPGGSFKPSSADMQATKQIQEAFAVVNISVIDHIIVAEKGYLSFAEKGILDSDINKLKGVSEQQSKYSTKNINERTSIKDKLNNIKADNQSTSKTLKNKTKKPSER